MAAKAPKKAKKAKKAKKTKKAQKASQPLKGPPLTTCGRFAIVEQADGTHKQVLAVAE